METDEATPDASIQPSAFSLPPSLWRAWLALVWLSFRRQANARQMVWIALALVGISVALVAINRAAGGWNMSRWRWPHQGPKTPHIRPTYSEWATQTEVLLGLVCRSPGTPSVPAAVLGTSRVIMTPDISNAEGKTFSVSGFEVFSDVMVSSIFLTFLLPLCSLSFAVDSIGGDRENQSLIWVLARPIPRPLVYLAKFVALLPWAVGLNLGGFAVICLAAGPAGRTALALYWQAILCATITFSSLFFLIGAWFRWPAVVALIYSFCLELVLGGMPGYLKYLSISYYARCLMFRRAATLGIETGSPDAYISDERIPLAVLVLTTAALLGIGMWLFSRKQYHEVG